MYLSHVPLGVAPQVRPGEVRPVWYGGSDSRLGELWTMLHVPYTLMVLSFVLVGAALAPRLSWTLLVGTLLAYFLGLGVGAHFLDQIPGMGSRYVRHWATRELWLGGLLAWAVAVGLGVVAAEWFVGWPLLAFVGIQGLCALGYPLARWFGGALHRDSVFAFSWGSLPFLTSYYAQSGTVDGLSVLVAGVFGAVAVLEIRLSRASRERRAAARASAPGRPEYPQLVDSFGRYDRALRLLALLTVAAGLGVLTGRVVLSVW